MEINNETAAEAIRLKEKADKLVKDTLSDLRQAMSPEENKAFTEAVKNDVDVQMALQAAKNKGVDIKGFNF